MSSKKLGSLKKRDTFRNSIALKPSKSSKISNSTPQSTHSNTLLLAANPIFNITTQLKKNNQVENKELLHQQIINLLTNFEKKARAHVHDKEALFMGRYALTIFLNEMISKTSWAKDVGWDDELLKTLKPQEDHDERFFIILEKVCQYPDQFIDLIELMYVCLSLGFEGKFKNAMAQQPNQLQTITNLTYRVIRNYRGEFEKNLSPSLNLNQTKKQIIKKVHFPIFKIASGTLLVIALTYGIVNSLLKICATPVLQQASTIAKAQQP